MNWCAWNAKSARSFARSPQQSGHATVDPDRAIANGSVCQGYQQCHSRGTNGGGQEQAAVLLAACLQGMCCSLNGRPPERRIGNCYV
jgi:hypothetical protein